MSNVLSSDALRAMKIHNLLDQASIPVHGVTCDQATDTLKVHFKAEATTEQREQAQFIVNSTAPRSMKDRNTIRTEITNLSLSEREALLNDMLIELIIDKLQLAPGAAEKLGHTLTGDESQ